MTGHTHVWHLCYGGLSPKAAAEHGIKPHWLCDCMFGDEPPAEEARAASASASGPLPALNVEWLALAISEAMAHVPWPGERGTISFGGLTYNAAARAIAAAYAAETPEQGR